MIKPGREKRRKGKKATNSQIPNWRHPLWPVFFCVSHEEKPSHKKMSLILIVESRVTQNIPSADIWNLLSLCVPGAAAPFELPSLLLLGASPSLSQQNQPYLSSHPTGLLWLSPPSSFSVFLSLWRSRGFSTGWFLLILDNPLWPLPGACPFSGLWCCFKTERS